MLDSATSAALRVALDRVLPAGRALGLGDEVECRGRVVDARVVGDEVLVLFRYARARHVFGIPTRIEELTESPWTGLPVQDLTEWVEELWWRLGEDLDTAVVVYASRRDVGEYIELRPPMWPTDDRFHVSVSGPDNAPPVAGEVIARVTASSNSSAGYPRVGQAIVEWREGGSDPVAVIGEVEIAAGVSRSVVWDLLHRAVHVGADAGAISIETTIAVDHLEVLGFRPGARGFVVDAALTEVDPQAVLALPECRNRRIR